MFDWPHDSPNVLKDLLGGVASKISPSEKSKRFKLVVDVMPRVSTLLLRDRDFLVSMIRAAGVADFGPYDPFAEKDGFLLQDPLQFADALILLSRYKIDSFVEIGTWNGKTVCFMTAFLRRFNPNLRAVSVDPQGGFRESYGLPVEYRVGTSEMLKGRSFDLCFIDGDHRFEWIKKDYENVGSRAPICMFHDIDDADFGILDPGRFWSELKSAEPENELHEFKSPGKHNMGIGIRATRAAKPLMHDPQDAQARSAPGALPSRAVYYAITPDPFYVYGAWKSIESLRRFNPTIDVHVFISLGRSSDAKVADVFRGTGATVWLADKTRLGFPVDGYFERYFLRWLALRNLTYESLLYVDADTVFSQDPDRLFEKLTEHDFYAREEMGAAPDQRAYLNGNLILYPQIDHSALSKAAAALSARKRPVFNTGVMLFNRSIHRDIAAKLSRMYDVYQDLVRGRLAYPSVNAHIKDEVTVSLVLGTHSNISCGLFDRELVPWYFEYKSGQARSPGIVMHVLNEFVPFYLKEFHGDAGLVPKYGGGTHIPAEMKLRVKTRLREAAADAPLAAPRRFDAAPSMTARERAGAGPWEMAARQVPRILLPNKYILEKHFYWRGLESTSGPGSDLVHTEAIRRALPALFKELGVRSLLDVACGDLNWMRRMQLELVRYVGVDFNPWHIVKHTLKHAAARQEFYCLDATRDPLPAVDLILCRDLLMHFPYADVFAALRNFKNSGSTYLLTTTYAVPEVNSEVPMGGFFQINLQAPPFELPPPMKLIDESNAAAFGPEYAGKCLGLWKLADILV